MLTSFVQNWKGLFIGDGKHPCFSWKCVEMLTFLSKTCHSVLLTFFLEPSISYSIYKVET